MRSADRRGCRSTSPTIASRSAGSVTPAERSSQRSPACPAAAARPAASRSSKAWISVPRSAAARAAALRRRGRFAVFGKRRGRERPRRTRLGRRRRFCPVRDCAKRQLAAVPASASTRPPCTVPLIADRPGPNARPRGPSASEPGQRPLDPLVPAILDGLALVDPGDHQPIHRPRHADVEQPPMLFEVQLLVVVQELPERLQPLVLARADDRALGHRAPARSSIGQYRQSSPGPRSRRRARPAALPAPWPRAPSSPGRR